MDTREDRRWLPREDIALVGVRRGIFPFGISERVRTEVYLRDGDVDLCLGEEGVVHFKNGFSGVVRDAREVERGVL